MAVASSDGIIFNTADGGGLGTLLDPSNLEKIKQLQVQNAFSSGFPTDANGNPDFTAAAKTLFQKGDLANGTNLLNVGLQQRGLQMGLDAANSPLLGGGGGPAAAGAAPGPASPSGTKGVNPDVASYIQSRAQALGINPNTALGVASSEGLRGFNPNGSANPGDGGSSFGPFQLHYGGVASGGNASAGLGDDFTKATGLDARDPSTWKQQVDFALGHVAKNGWGDFHGAKAAGIGQWTGIGSPPTASVAATPAPASTQPSAAPQSASPTGPSASPGFMTAADMAARINPNDPDLANQFMQALSIGADTQVDPTDPTIQQAILPAARASRNGVTTQVAQNGTSDAAPSSDHPYAPALPASPPPAPQGVAAPVTGQAPGSGSQSPMVDPTMGGLLTGQWVGNPGGYASALRATQARLDAVGQKAVADAYGKRADAIERGIERNDIVTPEMKNARDPDAIQYEQNRTDYQNQSSLQSATDPARITFAGQQAQAEADARNSADVAAASQRAEQGEEGKTLGQIPANLASAANSAKLQSGLVDQMLDAANQFSMGKYADKEAALNSTLSALGHAAGVDTSAIDNKLAGYQEYAKLAGQLTRQSVKDTGSTRSGVQEMQMISGTLPSPTMSPDGFRGIASQLKGVNDFTMAKQQAGQNWLNHNGTMGGFEASWNQNVTPAAFVMHRMQIDQPDLFQATVQRMAQTPQGRNVLSNVKAGLAWGGQQGLL